MTGTFCTISSMKDLRKCNSSFVTFYSKGILKYSCYFYVFSGVELEVIFVLASVFCQENEICQAFLPLLGVDCSFLTKINSGELRLGYFVKILDLAAKSGSFLSQKLISLGFLVFATFHSIMSWEQGHFQENLYSNAQISKNFNWGQIVFFVAFYMCGII